MTNVTTENIQQLRAPFPSSAIQWRVGSTNQDKTRGKALPYIDARIVQNRLDDAVGPQNWRNSYIEVVANGKVLAVRCVLGLKIDGEWVEKEDAAQLDVVQSDDQTEVAVKGVYSDSLKRAAVQWGIGRYLYEFDAPWVQIENNRLMTIPTLPNSMLPEAERTQGQPASTKRAEPPKAEVKTDVKPTPAPAPQPEAKQESKPEVKAEVKPTPAPAAAPAPAPAAAPAAAAQPEAKPEVKAEVKQEAKPAPTPTPAPEAKQADATRDVLAPQGTQASTPQDDERRSRADEMADQAAAKQPTPAAAPAPASQPQAQSDDSGKDAGDGSGDEMPTNISADQRKLAEEMLGKMDKLPAHMLRGYIDGPKGKEKFTDEVRVYLLKQLAKREAGV